MPEILMGASAALLRTHGFRFRDAASSCECYGWGDASRVEDTMRGEQDTAVVVAMAHISTRRSHSTT